MDKDVHTKGRNAGHKIVQMFTLLDHFPMGGKPDFNWSAQLEPLHRINFWREIKKFRDKKITSFLFSFP